MALGKRRDEQQAEWIATTELPKSPGHPFYVKLNQLLAEADFDAWVEKRCEARYAETMGRPSIPPGVYFRMLLIGYFKGLDSQRGIAWRCSDSRSLCSFLGLGPTEGRRSSTAIDVGYKVLGGNDWDGFGANSLNGASHTSARRAKVEGPGCEG